MTDPGPLYLQLVGPGALWIMVHCGGMCGPIVAGLQFGSRGPASAMASLGMYQLGRAATLASGGALAGTLGWFVADWLQEHGPWLILAVAAGMLVAVVRRLGWLPWPRAGGDDGALAARLLRPVLAWAARRPLWGACAIGAVLGALPCGVVYLALSLSAASGSALHGALLPVVLVAVSTPPLALAALGGAATVGRLRSRLGWVPTAALAVSAAWMVLHGLASLEYIPHVHVGKVMLW